MLSYLVIINSFVSDLYMKYIANMKCQLHHIHFEHCFIEQNQQTKSEIYVSIPVYLLQFIYIYWGRENSQQ